jgi:small-conductance mechanosensitive channel
MGAVETFVENIADWFSSGAWLAPAQRLLAAILIIAAAAVLARLLKFWLERLRRRVGDGDGARLVYIVEKIGGYSIILVGLLTGLSTLGLDLQSFTVFAGATGVGVGLGLQGVVREFVSGLVLIFNPAVRVGDFVELESGVRGEIAEIGARSTRLRTNDDLSIVIPNSKMIESRVVNWTFDETPRRFRVPFSVAEMSDKAKVREVVLAAAHKLPFTLPDSEERKTQVWLTGFAGNGLDFELIAWPRPEFRRQPASMHAAYMWAIHEALSAAGIDNCAPQMDLRVRSIFGQEGERALRILKLGAKYRPSERSPAAPVPNDAAAAVFDDAARDARTRKAEGQAERKRS